VHTVTLEFGQKFARSALNWMQSKLSWGTLRWRNSAYYSPVMWRILAVWMNTGQLYNVLPEYCSTVLWWLIKVLPNSQMMLVKRIHIALYDVSAFCFHLYFCFKYGIWTVIEVLLLFLYEFVMQILCHLTWHSKNAKLCNLAMIQLNTGVIRYNYQKPASITDLYNILDNHWIYGL